MKHMVRSTWQEIQNNLYIQQDKMFKNQTATSVRSNSHGSYDSPYFIGYSKIQGKGWELKKVGVFWGWTKMGILGLGLMPLT